MKKILAYILCLVAVGCTDDLRESGENVSNEAAEYLDVRTKGNGDGRSYIFYLIGNQWPAASGSEYYGTYLDVMAGQPVKPVEVNQQGVPVSGSYDSSQGLRASNGSYKLFVASPAVQMLSVSDELKGYHYTRKDEGVYISDPVDVNVNGVYLSDVGGPVYVYDASAQILRQPRSRLKLKFGCGSDIERTTLRSINLKNFISQGYYVPVEKRFHYSRGDILQEETLYPPPGGSPLTVKKNHVEDLNVDEYILSMNYGELDALGNAKFPMPSLEIEIGGANEGAIIFTAALGWDFKPQNAYEFTIIINSVYVNMQVVVSPWGDTGDVSSGIGSTEIWEVTFPLKEGSVNLLDWEKVDKQTGTIG